jgi:hypothetical protein
MPYIQRAWCTSALASPLRHEVQKDGRMRFWSKVGDTEDGQVRYLRVITLEDGETVHNAFFDRDFREDGR